MDHLILARRPELELINKSKGFCCASILQSETKRKQKKQNWLNTWIFPENWMYKKQIGDVNI